MTARDLAQAVLALDDALQARLVSAVAGAHRLRWRAIPADAPLTRAALEARGDGALWLVDVDRLHRERLAPGALIVALRTADPHAALLLAQSRRLIVDALLQGWARQAGAIGFVPNLAVERFASTVTPALQPAIESLGVAWDPAAAVAALSEARGDAGGTGDAGAPGDAGVAAAHAEPLARAHRALARLEADGLDLHQLARWAQGADGFACAERIWHLGKYRDCFVGSDAVTRMNARFDFDRALAVELGEALRAARVLQHVLNEHPFEDAELFYRFTPCTERVARLNMASLLAHVAGRGGFERKDRFYLGRVYRDCFIGAEAAEWLRDRYELDPDEAIYVGEALADLGAIRHVVGEHDFKDAGLYYEFCGFARE